MPHCKVLIVEDDQPLAEMLAHNLNQAGYEVDMVHNGQDGLTQARAQVPDVVLLDLMLPRVDGLEVCRRLRADPATREMLILMLTAKSDESDELLGFSAGADDYVTKPFSVKVLLQRIGALQRRPRGPTLDANDMVTSQGVAVDRRRYKATSDGRPLRLTRNEFRLLDALIHRPGHVFPRSELIDVALGEDTIVTQRTIDVHVRALRRKLGAKAELIETVRGVGYRFRDPGAANAGE